MTLDSLRVTLGVPGVSTDATLPRYSSEAKLLAATRDSLAKFLSTEAGAPDVAPAGLALTAAQQKAAVPIGQFGLAAAGVRTAFEEAVGKGPAAACWTGSWVGSAFPAKGGERLGSWAGDPDEALDMLRASVPSTAELAAFAHGFADGSGACV